MRLSQFFMPVSKDTPAEATITSHRLMLRAGLVRQTAAGIYAWLPLGLLGALPTRPQKSFSMADANPVSIITERVSDGEQRL